MVGWLRCCRAPRIKSLLLASVGCCVHVVCKRAAQRGATPSGSRGKQASTLRTPTHSQEERRDRFRCLRQPGCSRFRAWFDRSIDRQALDGTRRILLLLAHSPPLASVLGSLLVFHFRVVRWFLGPSADEPLSPRRCDDVHAANAPWLLTAAWFAETACLALVLASCRLIWSIDRIVCVSVALAG